MNFTQSPEFAITSIELQQYLNYHRTQAPVKLKPLISQLIKV